MPRVVHIAPRSGRRLLSRQGAAVVALLGLSAYFGHHALFGRYGLEAGTRLEERTQLVEFELRSLEAARARLARDVALLAPEHPDPDLVDEIAREMLGFAHPADRLLKAPLPRR